MIKTFRLHLPAEQYNQKLIPAFICNIWNITRRIKRLYKLHRTSWILIFMTSDADNCWISTKRKKTYRHCGNTKFQYKNSDLVHDYSSKTVWIGIWLRNIPVNCMNWHTVGSFWKLCLEDWEPSRLPNYPNVKTSVDFRNNLIENLGCTKL